MCVQCSIDGKARTSPFVLLSRTAISRNREVAKEHFDVLNTFVSKAVNMAMSEQTEKQIADSLSRSMFADYYKMKARTTMAMVCDGYTLATGLLGKKDYLLHAYGKAARKLTITATDKAIEKKLKPRLGKWMVNTSRIETETNAKRIAKVIWESRQVEEGLGSSVEDAARRLFDAGLAESETRADLLARTGTNWSYNESAGMAFKDAGIVKEEWLATADDTTCEWCMSMDGTVTNIEVPWAKEGDMVQLASGALITVGIEVVHPPAHPFCTCTVVPVVE